MPASNLPEHVRVAPPLPPAGKTTLITAFEGWNDAGDAATIAARELAKSWQSRYFARIDPEEFYDFTSSRPTLHLGSGGRREIKWPRNEMQAARVSREGEPTSGVVILIGVEPQLRWRTFCEQIVGTARVLGVERVITLGALLAEVPHSRATEVYGATDDDAMRADLDLKPSTYEGPTGIVGVLASACRDASLPTASFWAAVPSYMPGAPSPKAALALVKRAGAAVGMPVRTGELERAAQEYEAEIGKIVTDDAETAEYVARLEQAWDASRARSPRRVALSEHPDKDDPHKLVAEVEKFLRGRG